MKKIFFFQSDIYSLGIILLELLIPFNTDMERLKTIESARKGIIPLNIPPKFSILLKAYVEPLNILIVAFFIE